MARFSFNNKSYNTSELSRPQKQAFLGLFRGKLERCDKHLSNLYIENKDEAEIKKVEGYLENIKKLIKELE